MCQYQISEQSYFLFFLLLQILLDFLSPLSLVFDFIFQANEKGETLEIKCIFVRGTKLKVINEKKILLS
jgi:hypothetical protein